MPFNVDEFIERLLNCKGLKEEEIEILCSRVSDILAREPNLIKLKAPITICGDIHGQFKDLLNIFKNGACPEINYLFLGNYCNRGYDTIETVSLLFSLKLKYPDRITLLRGNQDNAIISQVHGFYDESMSKYQSSIVWASIVKAFNYLPLSAIINDKIFCVHGGLSPDLTLLEEIEPLQRVLLENPHTEIICDILWSDPDDILGWQLSPRGAGYLFGEDVTKQFIRTNNLNLIVRAHQFCMEGYKKMFGGIMITVWSAPNYCYEAGNLASILEIGENLNENYRVFAATDQSPCMKN